MKDLMKLRKWQETEEIDNTETDEKLHFLLDRLIERQERITLYLPEIYRDMVKLLPHDHSLLEKFEQAVDYSIYLFMEIDDIKGMFGVHT